MIAFPESQHVTGNFEGIKNSIVAGWKTFKLFITGKKDSSNGQLQVPSALQIRETSLKIYFHEFEQFLYSSDPGRGFSFHAMVYQVCHIFTSLSRIYVSTSSKPILVADVTTFDKNASKVKKVRIARYTVVCLFVFVCLSVWLSFTCLAQALETPTIVPLHLLKSTCSAYVHI